MRGIAGQVSDALIDPARAIRHADSDEASRQTQATIGSQTNAAVVLVGCGQATTFAFALATRFEGCVDGAIRVFALALAQVRGVTRALRIDASAAFELALVGQIVERRAHLARLAFRRQIVDARTRLAAHEQRWRADEAALALNVVRAGLAFFERAVLNAIFNATSIARQALFIGALEAVERGVDEERTTRERKRQSNQETNHLEDSVRANECAGRCNGKIELDATLAERAFASSRAVIPENQCEQASHRDACTAEDEHIREQFL